MIHVKKPAIDDAFWNSLTPDEVTEWADILAKSQEAKERAIDSYQTSGSVVIDDKLYKRYKKFVLRIFNNKCAYCEVDIPTSQPGDVEHFRPKGRISDDQARPVQVTIDGRQVPHPGYYWLAYDWKNLLPSCSACNRSSAGAGKADQFPLQNEANRALKPGDEINEVPLLIDPTETDPLDHFEFLANGMMKAKTFAAERTLKILGLNSRSGLMEKRAAAYQEAQALLRQYLNATAFNAVELERSTAHTLNSIDKGSEVYSAMKKRAVAELLTALETKNIKITFPLPEKPAGS